jgi:hypothetical protein
MTRQPAVRAVAVALAVLGALAAPAWAGSVVALSDAELDQVFGGEAVEPDNKAPGRTVVFQTTQTITGPVQQGASSMISVTALNSAVNAQLNLIVGDVAQATQINNGLVGQALTFR